MRINSNVHGVTSIEIRRISFLHKNRSGDKVFTADIVLKTDDGEYVITAFANGNIPDIQVEKHEVI